MIKDFTHRSMIKLKRHGCWLLVPDSCVLVPDSKF